MKYKIERDQNGFAQAISCDGHLIIHLIPGTVLNEKNADALIDDLNRKVVAQTLEKLPKRFVKFICEIANDGDWQYGSGASMTRDARSFLSKIGINRKKY